MRQFHACVTALFLLQCAHTATAEPLQAVFAPGNGAAFSVASSYATPAGVVGQRLLVTTAYSYGYNLWATDGTSQGTRLLSGDLIMQVIPADGAAYFLVDSYTAAGVKDVPAHGALWWTDGTPEGTRPLQDARGNGFSDVAAALALGRNLYFLWCPAGCELRTTDGTPEGTLFVAPADSPKAPLVVWRNSLYVFSAGALARTEPGMRGERLIGAFDSIQAFWPAQDLLYFSATGKGADSQLWATDGTPGGTRRLLRFLRPNALVGQPVAAGNRLAFLAAESTGVLQIWSSDGTPAGTEQVTDISHFTIGCQGLTPGDPIALAGDRVVFTCDQQLWTPGSHGNLVPLQPSLVLANGWLSLGTTVVFVAGTDGKCGIWGSDGTPAGTRLLSSLHAGACGAASGSSSSPMLVGGKALVWEDSSLWESDGTPAGTRQVFGGVGSVQYVFTVQLLGDRYYFDFCTDLNGCELWSSDGTAAGSHIVTDLANDDVNPYPFFPFFALVAAGNHVLFDYNNSNWGSDGVAGAVKLPGPDGLLSATALDDDVLYTAYDSNFACHLLRSDGTPEGTQELAALPGEGVLSCSNIARFGNQAALLHQSSAVELWLSDGTPAGTRLALLLPLPPNSQVGFASIAAIGPYLYFQLTGGAVTPTPGFPQDVWRTDGTIAGTQLLASPPWTYFAPRPDFTQVGSQVFFQAGQRQIRGGDVVSQLWATDGTPAGTSVVVDPVFNLGIPFLAYQDSLYFLDTTPSAVVPYAGRLVRLDGSVLVPVATFQDVDLGSLVQWQGRLFFQAEDAAAGWGLWTSDGTTAGTHLVARVALRDLTATPAGLFFAGDDGVHGYELWRSDGTGAGTAMLEDLNPGAPSSFPEQLTALPDRLVFTADDGLLGTAVWALPFAALTPAGCPPGPAHNCLQDGRFEVDVDWRDPQRPEEHAATATEIDPAAGYFWFYASGQPDVAVKIVHVPRTHSFQVYLASLTGAELTATVTDTRTGGRQRYFKPVGLAASLVDTSSFPDGGPAAQPPTIAPPPWQAGAMARMDSRSTPAPCSPAPHRLCLDGGRFDVTARFIDLDGSSGAASVATLSDQAGGLSFGTPPTLGALVKIIDGSSINGHAWVFLGGLSSLQYEVRVTDTASGAEKVYSNPPGQPSSAMDLMAF